MGANEELCRQRNEQAAADMIDALKNEIERLQAVCSGCQQERDAWHKLERLERLERKAAIAQRNAARLLCRRLIGAMQRWGSEGDGVPDASCYSDPYYGTAYDDAVAMLQAVEAEVPAPSSGERR